MRAETEIAVPTGAAIRAGDGYSDYHAEMVFPNGDCVIACRRPHLWAGEQRHPEGWEGAVRTGCGPYPECMRLVPVAGQAVAAAR